MAAAPSLLDQLFERAFKKQQKSIEQILQKMGQNGCVAVRLKPLPLGAPDQNLLSPPTMEIAWEVVEFYSGQPAPGGSGWAYYSLRDRDLMHHLAVPE